MTDPILSSEAEEIAKGLTKAQRSVVVCAIRSSRAFDERLKVHGTWRTTNRLFDLGITCPDEYLTELGLTVRAILQAQP